MHKYVGIGGHREGCEDIKVKEAAFPKLMLNTVAYLVNLDYIYIQVKCKVSVN